MTESEAKALIEQIVNRMLQDKGLETIRLEDSTLFLGGTIPIDSLDLAVIVTEMEATTRRDPFGDGFIRFQTVGELARLYAD